MSVKEFLHPFWWFAGMLICTVIFELLHGAFKQELKSCSRDGTAVIMML